MGKKIILVDDAASIRMMIKDILRKNGYTEIVETGNGEQVLAIYAAEKPGSVLMGITIPMMGGLEVFRRPHEMDSGARVVVCSMMGQKIMIVDVLKLGIKDLIVKSFKPNRIMETVNSILD